MHQKIGNIYKHEISHLKNKFNLNFDLEIWELLTMLTIVLSIASSIMWFNSIQPRNDISGFLLIEKQKHKTYADFTKVLKLRKLKISLISSFDSGNKCKTDIQSKNIDNLEYDKFMSQIEIVNKDLNTIKSDTIKEAQNYPAVPDLTTNTNIAQNQLDILRTSSQKQYTLAQKIFSIQKKVSQICSIDINDSDQLLHEIGSDLKHLEDFATDSSLDWKINLKSFIESFISIKSNPDQKDNKDLLQAVKTQFAKIFEFNLALDNNIEAFKNLDEQFFDSLKKMEVWQKQHLKDNEYLKSKLVPIVENF